MTGQLPIVAFALAATAVVATPGVGFAAFSSTMLHGGRKAAFPLVAGMMLGTVILAVLVIVWFPLAFNHAEELQRPIRLAGGCYLLYLAGRPLVGSRHPVVEGNADADGGTRRVNASGTGALRGALVELMNPGLLAFYLFILPPYAGPGHDWRKSAAILAAIHLTIKILWYAVLFTSLDAVRERVLSPRGRATGFLLTSLTLAVLACQLLWSAVRP